MDLLAGIDLAIEPGEFVGIFGTSGSGKSTLMDALNGRRPASEGAVLYNGTDLRASFALFKSTIGYVPQQDIVHRKITVRRALAYTARLRLPEDTSDAEIDGYIARVLARVGLAEKADQPIDTPVPLSGGQLKRVSLAVELVSNPAVLFLDEATSGLDAGTDKRMMRLFADLAADRKTVICVTHTLENVDTCNLVVVLFAGRLVYFGPPPGALDHFGLRRLSDVYETLETAPAEQWAERYAASPFHRDYVARRLADRAPKAEAAATRATVVAAPVARSSSWRQLGILARRYVDLILCDRRNLAILLAQAPIIGLVIGLVFDTGTTAAARATAESQIMFMLVISAIWFGCLNAAREIVKELPVYARERSVNLRIGPYVASKVLPLAVLCAVQCVVLLAVVAALVPVPGSFVARAAALFVTGMASTAMGLTVSAFVNTTDKAVALVPILLIPQVVLSNAVVPLGDASRTIAKGTAIAFWGFDCLKATLEAGVREARDRAGNVLVPVLGSYGGDLLWLAGFFALFLATTLLGLRLRDGSR
jgi:ABC-type multidrug transport system ATPase subunit